MIRRRKPWDELRSSPGLFEKDGAQWQFSVVSDNSECWVPCTEEPTKGMEQVQVENKSICLDL